MDKVLLFKRITDAKEVAAAAWLSRKQDPWTKRVYADFRSVSNVLTSYGMMSEENIRELVNNTQFVNDADCIYLRGVNSEQGVMMGNDGPFSLSNSTYTVLESQSLIYSNQESVVLWTNSNHSISIPP